MTAPPSFTCPKCGATSYSINDVRFGYCGNCHEFTGVGPRYIGLESSSFFSDGTYDLHGNPISMERHQMLEQLKRETDPTDPNPWWRVASDKVGDYWISTVWTGWEPAVDVDKPRIFQTAIFKDGELQDYEWRYDSWEAAQAGHADAVKLVEILVQGNVAADILDPEEA